MCHHMQTIQVSKNIKNEETVTNLVKYSTIEKITFKKSLTTSESPLQTFSSVSELLLSALVLQRRWDSISKGVNNTVN